jgi:hypothetical protein
MRKLPSCKNLQPTTFVISVGVVSDRFGEEGTAPARFLNLELEKSKIKSGS